MPNEQPWAKARHPLVVGELAYKPIAITQFRPFAVNGWFMQRRSHICTTRSRLCLESDHVEEDSALAPPKAGSSGGVSVRSSPRQEGGDSGGRFASGKAKMIRFVWVLQ